MRILTNGRGVHPDASAALHAWSFSQTTATDSLLDMCGAATLTDSGSPATGFASPVEVGRQFDGTDDYFYGAKNGTDAAALTSAGWTIMAWVKPDATYAADGFIVDYADAQVGPLANQNRLLSLKVESDRTLSVIMEHGAGVSETATTALTIPAGVWTHVAVVFNNSLEYARFYLNGSYVEDQDVMAPTCAGSANTQGWYVGAAATDQSNKFTGVVSSLAVWSSQLAAADVEDAFWRGMLWVPHAATFCRVRIGDASGALTDVSTGLPGGRDWLSGVELRDDVDARGIAGTVRLFREASDSASLAKYHDNRLNRTPLTAIGPETATYTENTTEFLANNRRIKIDFARMPMGSARPGSGSSDWHTVLDGMIDEIDWSGDEVVLQVQDLAVGMLSRAYQEDEADYGDDGGTVEIEAIIQSILDDSYTAGWVGADPDESPAAAFQLYTPTSPSWAVKLYRQRREDLWQTMATLAEQFAWRVKRKWDPLAGEWRVTLYEPERTRTVANAVIDPDQYHSVARLNQNLNNVRNVVRVVYASKEAAQTSSVSVPSGFVQNQGWEGGRNSHDDPTAAWVEWENTASIAKYGRRFMEICEGATSQIDTQNEADTMALGILRDLCEPAIDQSIEMEPLFNLEVSDLIRWKANNRHYTGDQKLAVVGWRLSATPDRCVMDVQCRGKPSGGARVHLAKETRGGEMRPPVRSGSESTTGTSWGNRRTALWGLVHETDMSRSGRGSTVKNPDFSSRLFSSLDPPDGWGMQAGTWVTDADVDATNALSGPFALALKTSTGKPRSDWISVASGVTYQAEALWKASASNAVTFTIEWYKADRTASTTATSTVITDTLDTSWRTSRNYVVAPSDARWARIRLERA